MQRLPEKEMLLLRIGYFGLVAGNAREALEITRTQRREQRYVSSPSTREYETERPFLDDRLHAHNGLLPDNQHSRPGRD